MLLHFNLAKHLSYFDFRFVTTVDPLYCLFGRFQMLNSYTVPFLLVNSVQKRHCYLSLSILSFQIPRYVTKTLNAAFPPLKTSPVHRFFHFNWEKHHSYSDFIFSTTVELFQCLFWLFYTPNTSTVPCLLVDSVEKRNPNFTASALTSKSISGTLFLFWHFNFKIHQP